LFAAVIVSRQQHLTCKQAEHAFHPAPSCKAAGCACKQS
jgi:hypothetical protein